MEGPISAAVAEAIRRSGLTHYAIAKAAGIRPQMLDYFMAGTRSLRLDTIDKLAPVLGLRLAAVKGRAKSSR